MKGSRWFQDKLVLHADSLHLATVIGTEVGKGSSYQVLDEGLQLLLRLFDSVLSSHDSNQLLIFVLRGWEDDAGPGVVTHLTDVATPLTDKEFVVLWLCTEVHGVTLCLLKRVN